MKLQFHSASSDSKQVRFPAALGDLKQRPAWVTSVTRPQLQKKRLLLVVHASRLGQFWRCLRERRCWLPGGSHLSPVACLAGEQPTRNAGSAPSTENLVRYRAVVAYDGTDFHGFQRQAKSRATPTIQGRLEAALQQRLGGYPWHCQVVGAGRTDAGVHARGQVIHFDIPEQKAATSAFEPSRLEHALNRLLPRTIQVRAMEVSPPPAWCLVPSTRTYQLLPWHAIYRAQGKRYVYRLSAGAWIDPLYHRYAYTDYRQMQHWAVAQQMLQKFVGTHDFGAFASSPPGKADRHQIQRSTVRTIRRISVEPSPVDSIVPVWKFEFELDGALYRMIRNIMGTFLAVARGELDDALVVDALQQGSRGRALIAPRVKPAPAHGLCLERVYYADGYPVRQDVTADAAHECTHTVSSGNRGAPLPPGADVLV
jgi:tRNA pseudouridine38-40 synthase